MGEQATGDVGDGGGRSMREVDDGEDGLANCPVQQRRHGGRVERKVVCSSSSSSSSGLRSRGGGCVLGEVAIFMLGTKGEGKVCW